MQSKIGKEFVEVGQQFVQVLTRTNEFVLDSRTDIDVYNTLLKQIKPNGSLPDTPDFLKYRACCSDLLNLYNDLQGKSKLLRDQAKDVALRSFYNSVFIGAGVGVSIVALCGGFVLAPIAIPYGALVGSVTSSVLSVPVATTVYNLKQLASAATLITNSLHTISDSLQAGHEEIQRLQGKMAVAQKDQRVLTWSVNELKQEEAELIEINNKVINALVKPENPENSEIKNPSSMDIVPSTVCPDPQQVFANRDTLCTTLDTILFQLNQLHELILKSTSSFNKCLAK